MNAEQYTRCPHCKATFEVTESQLSAAGGKVRCGACMEVFDALAYLINGQPDSDDNTATTPSQPSHKEYSDKASLDASGDSEHIEPISNEDDDDDFIFEDSDEDRAQAKKSMFDESQLSDSLKSVDTSKAHAFSSESNDDEDDQEDNTEEDESWANKILSDDNDTPEIKAEPKDRPTSEPKLTTARPAAKPAREKTQPEAIDFYYEETETVRARGIFSKLMIILGCLVLLVVLIAQAAWFHYEKLVQYPIAKTGFEMACEQIGCTLPELVDLNAIKSNNLVVRSHPITPNSLIIDVVLTNEASFDQDYPRLALYFSDINGKTVAQQIVPPNQYLNDKALEKALMPRNKPIHVSLEIEDPGKRAVNYKIRFFPSKGQQNQ